MGVLSVGYAGVVLRRVAREHGARAYEYSLTQLRTAPVCNFCTIGQRTGAGRVVLEAHETHSGARRVCKSIDMSLA